MDSSDWKGVFQKKKKSLSRGSLELQGNFEKNHQVALGTPSPGCLTAAGGRRVFILQLLMGSSFLCIFFHPDYSVLLNFKHEDYLLPAAGAAPTRMKEEIQVY